MADKPEKPVKGKNGGARKGAGRKKGSRDIASAEQRQAISTLAREHTDEALKSLLKVCRKSKSDAAMVSAAEAILNRGYGRPAQSMELNVTGTLVLADRVKRAKERSGAK